MNYLDKLIRYIEVHSVEGIREITVPGLIWGKSLEWETLIPAVNPISYAMMGLLPQMHRNEQTISKIVSQPLKAACNIDYVQQNVPCAYLKE